jgi:hypothetical protein
MSRTPARSAALPTTSQPADMCWGKRLSVGEASRAMRTAICTATSAVTAARKMTSDMGRFLTVSPPYPCPIVNVALQHSNARSRDLHGQVNATLWSSSVPGSRHGAAAAATLPLGGARFGRRMSGLRPGCPAAFLGARVGGAKSAITGLVPAGVCGDEQFPPLLGRVTERRARFGPRGSSDHPDRRKRGLVHCGSMVCTRSRPSVEGDPFSRNLCRQRAHRQDCFSGLANEPSGLSASSRAQFFIPAFFKPQSAHLEPDRSCAVRDACLHRHQGRGVVSAGSSGSGLGPVVRSAADAISTPAPNLLCACSMPTACDTVLGSAVTSCNSTAGQPRSEKPRLPDRIGGPADIETAHPGRASTTSRRRSDADLTRARGRGSHPVAKGGAPGSSRSRAQVSPEHNPRRIPGPPQRIKSPGQDTLNLSAGGDLMWLFHASLSAECPFTGAPRVRNQ